MAYGDQLVCYLKFDETSGTFLDGTANANNATTSGSPSRPAGLVGNCLQVVAGSSQYGEVADAISIRWGAFDSCIDFFFMLDSKTGTQWLINKGKSDGSVCEIGFAYNAGTDRMMFFIGAGASQKVVTASSFGSPSTGVWYHAYCEFNSATGVIGISINNGTMDTTSSVSAPTGGTQPLVFGAFSTHDFFASGKFDEFGQHNRLLTSGERSARYNAGVGATWPDATGIPFFLLPDHLSGGMATLAGGL